MGIPRPGRGNAVAATLHVHVRFLHFTQISRVFKVIVGNIWLLTSTLRVYVAHAYGRGLS
jgi:hypothetical protein